jgi:hypothetical protein
MSEADLGGSDVVPISEHSRVLIAMHKAMRADAQRLIAAASALPNGDPHRSRTRSRLRRHRRSDPRPPLDRRRRHVPVPAGPGEQLRARRDPARNDHVELDAAMARINARFRLLAHQLSAPLWQDTRSHLLDEATAFNRVLVDHLDREEDAVIPPLESMISEAEQHTLQKEEAKLATYRHMRLAVPWVLANATPEEEEQLRTTAPRLLGVIQDRVWEPRFVRLMAPLYASTGT